MQATYYKYDFISPEPLYALVREELKSYFDSGSVDDTLFSLWTERVLRKLSKGTLPIRPVFLKVHDGRAHLPLDFKYVRELWSLEEHKITWTDPANTYTQILTSTRIDSPDVQCNPCSEYNNPPTIEAIYKTNRKVIATYQTKQLLRPARVIHSPLPCANSTSNDAMVYDIEDGEIKTNFPEGVLYLLYYAEERDAHGFQLVPDDVRILEAVEAFLKFKINEMLFNQTTDETFNQTRYKMEKSEQAYLEKFIIAETWMKKQTKEQKNQSIARQKRSLNKYKFRN